MSTVGGRRAGWVRALAVLVVASAAVTAACRREPVAIDPPRPPRDTLAPQLQVTFPTDAYGAYDRDSNGLADLEVAWHDSGGAVNPASFRITCLDCLPAAAQDTNLATGWRPVRRDSSGAVLEETVPLLMRSGSHLLKLTVADTAGNVSPEKLVYLNLPPGAYHRSIDLAYHPEWQQVRAAHLVLTPDGRKGFVPFIDGHLAVFDPEGVAPTHWVGPVANSCFAAQIALDSTTGLAYIGGGGCETAGYSVVDTRAERELNWYLVGMGLASVELAGDRIYTGESCTTGRIIVLDKTTNQEIGRVETNSRPYGASCPNATTFALSRDGRTGWAGMVGGGIVTFDATTYTRTGRTDVWPPPGDSLWGNVRDLILLDDRWLYASLIEWGLDEYDIVAGSRTAHNGSLIHDLALSPDHKLLFATTNEFSGLANVGAPLLFEVPGLRLRYAFPPRPGAIQDGAVFHPDGKRVYVITEFHVEVYLVRPL